VVAALVATLVAALVAAMIATTLAPAMAALILSMEDYLVLFGILMSVNRGFMLLKESTIHSLVHLTTQHIDDSDNHL
jgi:hypothetical protein